MRQIPDAKILPSVTVAELETLGFTDVYTACGCGRSACLPFVLLKKDGFAGNGTKFGNIAGRLRCSQCGAKPREIKPWYQYMGTPQERMGIPSTYGGMPPSPRRTGHGDSD